MRHAIFALSAILLLSGCGKQSPSSSAGGTRSSRSLGFEDKPFLGLALGISEEDVTAAFEASGLPYQVEKDKYDESVSILDISVKGNARLKGQNKISVCTKSGTVTSVSVMSTTREGIIQVEGEKEKADQMFEALLSVLTKQHGKPDLEATVKGNRVARWVTDDALVSLEREFYWDKNIFIVKTHMELIPPGEADKMRK